MIEFRFHARSLPIAAVWSVMAAGAASAHVSTDVTTHASDATFGVTVLAALAVAGAGYWLFSRGDRRPAEAHLADRAHIRAVANAAGGQPDPASLESSANPASAKSAPA
jgi:hypothetical protein